MCASNAQCVRAKSPSVLPNYTCECPEGYHGPICEFTNKEEAPSCTLQCQNGGKCVDHFTHYTCECAEGFSGKDCSVNVDDCKDHMCQVQKHTVL